MAIAAVLVAILLFSGMFRGPRADFAQVVAFASLLYAFYRVDRFLRTVACHERDPSYLLCLIHFPTAGADQRRGNPDDTIISRRGGCPCTDFGLCLEQVRQFSVLAERTTGKARAFLRHRFG